MSPIGIKIPFTTIEINTINKTGVKNFPIASTIEVGFKTKNKQTAKNTTVVINELADGNNVTIPNSYVVEAVRGIAITGPSAKIKMAVDTIANRGPTREAIFSNDPSAREQAKIPKRGRPTPVNKNPNKAGTN